MDWSKADKFVYYIKIRMNIPNILEQVRPSFTALNDVNPQGSAL
jgi:hypothetical protein